MTERSFFLSFLFLPQFFFPSVTVAYGILFTGHLETMGATAIEFTIIGNGLSIIWSFSGEMLHVFPLLPCTLSSSSPFYPFSSSFFVFLPIGLALKYLVLVLLSSYSSKGASSKLYVYYYIAVVDNGWIRTVFKARNDVCILNIFFYCCILVSIICLVISSGLHGSFGGGV